MPMEGDRDEVAEVAEVDEVDEDEVDEVILRGAEGKALMGKEKRK